MTVTLEEVKTYLRIDYEDEDVLLQTLIQAATELCADVVRIPAAELMEQVNPNLHTAVLYTVAYLYEHREKADHRTLTLTLRSLLFGVRREGF